MSTNFNVAKRLLLWAIGSCKKIADENPPRYFPHVKELVGIMAQCEIAAQAATEDSELCDCAKKLRDNLQRDRNLTYRLEEKAVRLFYQMSYQDSVQRVDWNEFEHQVLAAPK